MNINTPFTTDPVKLNLLHDSHRGIMKHTLMNDFLSKYSFQHDLYALKGLLAALLRLEPDDITHITILNPIAPGDYVTDKECVMDILLTLNNHKIINIEVQSRFQDFWPERSITYLCRNFDHLKPGESYNLIKPCIQIGILANSLFKPSDPRYTDDFYSEYRLLNVKNHSEYSSKFEIRVLSLNQLENASDEDKSNPNGLYRWAKLFRASTWEEVKMIAEDNTMMSSLVGTVMELTAEEKVAQACEARRRYSNDVATYEEEIATRDARLAEKNSILAEKDSAIAEKDSAIAEMDSTISIKDSLIAEKDSAIAEKDSAIAEKDMEIEKLKAQLQELKRNAK